MAVTVAVVLVGATVGVTVTVAGGAVTVSGGGVTVAVDVTVFVGPGVVRTVGLFNAKEPTANPTSRANRINKPDSKRER